MGLSTVRGEAQSPGFNSTLAPTAPAGPQGPLTFSCRAARRSPSSCPCFSCDCVMAALCSSESSFRASCSWTKWLAISRSCEGENPQSQRKVRARPRCPGLCSAPRSRALSAAASMDIPGPGCSRPAPAAPHAGNATQPLFPPPRFPFGSASGAQSRLSHWVKVTRDASVQRCHQILPLAPTTSNWAVGTRRRHSTPLP